LTRKPLTWIGKKEGNKRREGKKRKLGEIRKGN